MSFRLKLLCAMVLLVFGFAGASLSISQKQVRSTYDEITQELFQTQMQLFRERQAERLENVKRKCLELSRSVRLFAAVEDGDAELIYQTTGDELRTVSGNYSFYRLLDAEGNMMAPQDPRAGFTELDAAKRLEESLLESLRGRGANPSIQSLGYMVVKNGSGQNEFQEMIMTRIEDGEDSLLGYLVIGFPFEDLGGLGSKNKKMGSGIIVKGKLYSGTIPSVLTAAVEEQVNRQIQMTDEAPANWRISLGQELFQADYQPINLMSRFPRAFQVILYNLQAMIDQEKAMQNRIILLTCFSLLGAALLSWFISAGLSVPIRRLVKGTREIHAGNLEVKIPIKTHDEFAELARSFNEMTEGLALKEKYRQVLSAVTDEAIAKELMKGGVALGGEIRVVSVLFCDIRGFTAKTEKMKPDEVVRMLNEHMTAMTGIVHEFHGVVDKFVGDLIMAIFGAPRQAGEDSQNAVACAVKMIAEREKLNQTSQYQLEIGIGVATGEALAGCMGSRDRLNYTVLGERVNLASRLCSKAPAQEVIIDSDTFRQLAPGIGAKEVLDLKLKGYAEAVRAYQVIKG